MQLESWEFIQFQVSRFLHCTHKSIAFVNIFKYFLIEFVFLWGKFGCGRDESEKHFPSSCERYVCGLCRFASQSFFFQYLMLSNTTKFVECFLGNWWNDMRIQPSILWFCGVLWVFVILNESGDRFVVYHMFTDHFWLLHTICWAIVASIANPSLSLTI